MSLLRLRTPLARLPALARASSSLPTPAPLSMAPTPPAQSPNVAAPWSENQEPKADAFAQARFEQTAFGLQPDGLSAMGLVNEVPIVKLASRRAVCDGGECLGQPELGEDRREKAEGSGEGSGEGEQRRRGRRRAEEDMVRRPRTRIWTKTRTRTRTQTQTGPRTGTDTNSLALAFACLS
jgi:hypothetical protein